LPRTLDFAGIEVSCDLGPSLIECFIHGTPIWTGRVVLASPEIHEDMDSVSGKGRHPAMSMMFVQRKRCHR
jgi:hypothetical protein